jgi:hypothetical protein
VISDWKTGEVFREVEVKPGDAFFFGWVHSLEKIPWNEYYHIEADEQGFFLVLDSISVPAFGAGIPEDRGKVCRIENGIICMEEIDQRFDELVWINSHFAVRDIALNGELIARGLDLPEHQRLQLKIRRK